MTISTRPRHETVELAGRLLEKKTIDGVTIEDVHHLAARILDDQEYAPKESRATKVRALLKSIGSTEPEPSTRAD